MRPTRSAGSPRRHWKIAECSESTGTIRPGAASGMSSSPPTTIDSLLARARRFPARRADSEARRPAAPTRALRTMSASGIEASSATASGPDAQEAPSGRSAAQGAEAGSATAVRRTPNSRACPASCAPLVLAASATISTRSGNRAATWSVWRPIEPVDPSRTTRTRPAGGVTARHRTRACSTRRSRP